MARVPAGHNRVPAGQTGLESQFILKRLGVLYYIAGHMIESQFILKRAGVLYYTGRSYDTLPVQPAWKRE